MPRVSGFITYVDHSDEKSTMGFNLLDPLTDDLEVLTIDDMRARLIALNGAISAVVEGAPVSVGFTANYPQGGTASSTAPSAQREMRWQVSYVDSLEYYDDPTNTIPNQGFGKTFTLDLPTAELGLGTPQQPAVGTDEVDIAIAPFAALVTALQTYHFSPYGGNITVTGIKFVGANN